MLTIIHGDALSELSRLPDQSFAAIVTSPPYNMGHTNPPGKSGPGGVARPGRYRGGYGDDDDRLTPDEYVGYHRAVVAELLRVLQPDGLLWYVHRRKSQSFPDGSPALVDQVLGGYPVRSEIIWDKGGPGPGFAAAGATGGAYWPTAAYETVFLLSGASRKARRAGKPGEPESPAAAPLLNRSIAAAGDIWRIPRQRVPGHPATFPVELARRAIAATIADGPVLDPFAGAGTTAIAALVQGRPCTLIERRSEYIALARRRIDAQMQPRLR